MKNLNFMIAALMTLSFSTIFSSCSSDEDSNDTTQAKAVAGTYKGYSIGTSGMFSDYLMGTQATTLITANEDGTINLIYTSGSGDFKLDNLTVTSGKFSGTGAVNLAMNGGSGSSYAYSLEGSVDGSKVLTLKANIPTIMNGLDVNFIQGETPIAYYVANTYKYQTNLALSVNSKPFGSTTICRAIVKRASTGTGVDITVNGFDQIGGGNSAMTLGNFTIKDVNLAAGTDGAYTLSLGVFNTTDTNGILINGMSLSGTIAANGITTITIVFSPGSMPIPITAAFTGNHTEIEAE